VNSFHFRAAVFVHVGPEQLRTENCVSFYMCSAKEVAWLAHNILHSSISTSVQFRLVAFSCL